MNGPFTAKKFNELTYVITRSGLPVTNIPKIVE